MAYAGGVGGAGGYCCYPTGGGAGRNIAFILVLFVLLVIILRAMTY